MAKTNNEVLVRELTDLNIGMMSLDDGEDENKPTPVKRIPTKFPPPPYLPGELERRAALLIEDSDNERQR